MQPVMGRHLLAIDGSNLMMRAFHALQMKRPEDGLERAVVPMLRKAISLSSAHYLVVALDHPTPCFRYGWHKEYKGTRPKNGPTAGEMAAYMKPFFDQWGVAWVESEGFEADDVLATLAERCRQRDTPFYALTRDEDILQTVTDRSWVIWPLTQGRTTLADVDWVLERTGVLPEQIADWKALSGCGTDNVPKVGKAQEGRDGKVRVYGITADRAAALLHEYYDIPTIYDNLADLTERERGWFEHCREQVKVARYITRLRTDAPLELDPRSTAITNIRWP